MYSSIGALQAPLATALYTTNTCWGAHLARVSKEDEKHKAAISLAGLATQSRSSIPTTAETDIVVTMLADLIACVVGLSLVLIQIR